MKNWIKKETSIRGINIMWKSRGRIGLRLNRRLKCSQRNYRMRMKSSKVA
jgi:hypothetical protein